MLTKVEVLGLAATAIGLFALRLASLPGLLFFPLLAVLTGLIYFDLAEKFSFQRRLLADVYLRQESSFAGLLRQPSNLRYVLVAPASVLAFITYVAIYSSSAAEWIAICGGLVLAQVLVSQLRPLLNKNFADPFSELYARRLFIGSAVILVLIGIALGTLVTSVWSDHSTASARSNADLTIKEVKHRTKLVRHCVRTKRFLDLELLRVRDIQGWPYGWAIFFYFLIPNAVPAVGVVSLYGSAKLILRNKEAPCPPSCDA